MRDAMAVGASVCAVGQLVASSATGASWAETLTVLGKCPADFPLQKKRHTLEYPRTIPHLRVRTRSLRQCSPCAISWHRRCINTSTATVTATFMPPSLPDRTARGG